MPLQSGASITTLLGDLQQRVRKFDITWRPPYVGYWVIWERFRNKHTVAANTDWQALLADTDCCDWIWCTLANFGMNNRRAKLSAGLRTNLIQLHANLAALSSVPPSRISNDASAHQYLVNLYQQCLVPHFISETRSFVAASKVLHFLLPTHFLIVDRAHSAKSLSNIADYYPSSTNHRWNSAILIPTPRNKRCWNREDSWDEFTLLSATLFARRIFDEWVIRNKGRSEDDFLRLDPDYPYTSVMRVVDKALY